MCIVYIGFRYPAQLIRFYCSNLFFCSISTIDWLSLLFCHSSSSTSLGDTLSDDKLDRDAAASVFHTCANISVPREPPHPAVTVISHVYRRRRTDASVAASGNPEAPWRGKNRSLTSGFEICLRESRHRSTRLLRLDRASAARLPPPTRLVAGAAPGSERKMHHEVFSRGPPRNKDELPSPTRTN